MKQLNQSQHITYRLCSQAHILLFFNVKVIQTQVYMISHVGSYHECFICILSFLILRLSLQLPVLYYYFHVLLVQVYCTAIDCGL